MLLPGHQLLFGRPARAPNVRFLASFSSTADTTAYTFSNCPIDLGTDMSTDTSGDQPVAPNQRSIGRKAIIVCVHSEDAATTFGITSVSMGGVNLFEAVDRGGATSAINTAIYWGTGQTLQGITNTDIVVTHTEAVTCCSIGILIVENIGLIERILTLSAVGTGTLSLTSGSTIFEPFMLVLMAATCATGGGTEKPQFSVATSGGSGAGPHPILLYEDTNAEIDFAAAWLYLPNYTGQSTDPVLAVTADWSGAGAGDAVLLVLR